MTVTKITQTNLYASASQTVSQLGQNGAKSDFSQIFAAQSSEGGAKTQMKTDSAENSKAEEVTETEDVSKTEETTVEKQSEETEAEEKVTETVETDEAQNAQNAQMEEAYTEAVEEAVIQIMAAIQQVLGVTQEELQAALQELGISTEDLLNTDMIPKIVVALTEGADELSVMTDENVFSNVQELTALVEETVNDLSKQLNVEPEELRELLQGMMETEIVEEEVVVKPVVTEQTVDAPVMEEVRVQAPVVEAKSSTKADDNHQNAEEGTQQQMNFAQTVTERIEQAVAKTEAMYSQTTTESVMRQIEDVIKVIQKENLTEMELQLHPASLGSVRVALAAKEGVITATFTAENEAVRAAIESQMLTLKQSFEAQGIKVEAVEVTVASHAFERNLSGEGNANTNEEATSDKKKGARRITLSGLNDDMTEEELSDEDRIVAEMMKQNGNTVDYTV